MGKIVTPRNLLMAIGIALCLSGGVMSCKENNSVIVIEGPTKCYLNLSIHFIKEVKEIAVLDKEITPKLSVSDIQRIAWFIKIKLADGRVGYITYGDKFKVI